VGGVGGAKAESRERRRLGKEDGHGGHTGSPGQRRKKTTLRGRSPIVRTLRLSPTMTPKPILGYWGAL
jgi:hypothetical protein